MGKDIYIRELATKKEIKQFVMFPFELYKNHPRWVPPIINDELKDLDKKTNPVFDFCSIKFFAAYIDNKMVGRSLAMVNHMENKHLGIKKMRFGWFDVIDDIEVTRAILYSIENWADELNLDFVEGPLGFTNLDKAGMLTQGFDELSTIVTYYNYDYYPKHLEKLGYKPETKWLEYEIQVPKSVPEKVSKFAQKIGERYGLKPVRFTTKKEIKALGNQLFDVLNEAYSKLPYFIPITEEQKQFYIQKFMGIVEPSMISCVQDSDQNIVGFAITMPSFSRALQKAKGKLFPFGIFHLLKAKKTEKVVELTLIGVHPDYQSKGVTAILFKEIIESVNKMGYTIAESNPEFEHNNSVQSLWGNYETRIHKRRCSFRKNLSS